MARPTASCIVLLSVIVVSFVPACASSTGGSIPVDQFKDEPEPAVSEYIIGIGDMVTVQVYDQPQMSGRLLVRPDGRISLPLVGDADAAGKTLRKLASDLEGVMKSVILNPRVTVSLEGSKPLTISVLGEVAKPGPQPLERDTGVAQALAAAGGLTNFAHRDRIFVVRTTPKQIRIHFTYDALTRSVGAASTFRLKAGDVVVVE